MNNTYYYVGLVVTWLFITLFGALCLLILGAAIWRAWSWFIRAVNIGNFISYYITRRTVNSESLRWFYIHSDRNRKYIYLYRLRNIRRAR